MTQVAKALKAKLKAYITKQKPLRPNSTRSDAFHNPIALALHENKLFLTQAEKSLIEQCEQSARLFITHTNERILRTYFLERQAVNDALGNLYKTLSFSDFVLRLWNKRFKEVCLDGRALVGRKKEHFENLSSEAKKALLQNLGSSQDNDKLYLEYLTLEEMVLSPLVLPQAMSLVIGTGNRSSEQDWDILKELETSIDVASISYPAAAEFRNGNTAHYDLWFIAQPSNPDEEYLHQLEKIKNNPALMNAARHIYGPKLAFELERNAKEGEDFIWLSQEDNPQAYRLSKSAYSHRTKNILQTVLLAADHQMQLYQLGETFQLKGLGLGAFSFGGKANTEILEKLYREALEAVIADVDFQLQYIQGINLINLPSDLANGHKTEVKPEMDTNPAKAQPIQSQIQQSQAKRQGIWVLIAILIACASLTALTVAAAAMTLPIALAVFGGIAIAASAIYKKYAHSSSKFKVPSLEGEGIQDKLSRKEEIALLIPSIPQIAPPASAGPGFKISTQVMDPTARDTLCDIGGVVVCGDSGSKFGNEGNIGLTRSSSDDPAAQYSLLNPYILDSDVNPILQKLECIRILGRYGQVTYLEPDRARIPNSPSLLPSTPKL